MYTRTARCKRRGIIACLPYSSDIHSTFSSSTCYRIPLPAVSKYLYYIRVDSPCFLFHSWLPLHPQRCDQNIRPTTFRRWPLEGRCLLSFFHGLSDHTLYENAATLHERGPLPFHVMCVIPRFTPAKHSAVSPVPPSHKPSPSSFLLSLTPTQSLHLTFLPLTSLLHLITTLPLAPHFIKPHLSIT